MVADGWQPAGGSAARTRCGAGAGPACSSCSAVQMGGTGSAFGAPTPQGPPWRAQLLVRLSCRASHTCSSAKQDLVCEFLECSINVSRVDLRFLWPNQSSAE